MREHGYCTATRAIEVPEWRLVRAGTAPSNNGRNYDGPRHQWQGAKHRPAIFFCKLIRYTVRMKTIIKSTTTKSSKKTSTWEKAAGLLKSKKTTILKELTKGRKSWDTK